MEITTIVGIVIAVVIMVVGLFLLFRKPRDAAPSLESELHINDESQQPIIPRHVRDQLQVEEAERVEPTLAEDVIVEVKETVAETASITSEKEDAEQAKASEIIEKSEAKAVEEVVLEKVQNTQKEEQSFSVNQQIDKAEIADFNEESSILDAHLHEQNRVDDECALVTAESFIALNIISKGRILSGEKTLKVLLKYGLRFGEMKCFHRYNDDGSKLLFSVLKLTEEGTEGFDLETLSTEEVKGLACFLALPHGDVQNAFDTMVSIAGLIAREIDGVVLDQENYELTPQLREYWRHQAIDYKSQKNIRA
jgi:cell division protein ZipA